MNYRAQNEPHPSQIDRFLAWAFGWTWGFWGAAVLLRNLWAGNPVEISLLLLGAFGPMAASFAVLKKKSLKNIFSFLFSGNKGAWRYFFIYGGVWTAVVAVSSNRNANKRKLNQSAAACCRYCNHRRRAGGTGLARFPAACAGEKVFFSAGNADGRHCLGCLACPALVSGGHKPARYFFSNLCFEQYGFGCLVCRTL